MDLDSAEAEVQTRKNFQRILVFGNTLGLSLVGLVVIWGAVLKFGGISLSSVPGLIGIHSTLMVLFMLYIHGISSLVYRILPLTPKYPLKLIHAGLHFLIIIGSASGLACAIEIHNSNTPSSHFYSLHSWLGLASLGIYYLQFIGGFLTFLVQVTPKVFRLWALSVHRIVGQIVLYFACGAVLTGLFQESSGSILDSSAGVLPLAGIVLNISGLVAVSYVFIIGYLLNEIRFRRPTNSNEEEEAHPLFASRRERVRIYSGHSTKA